jgi:uncharacterized protein YjbI with pentapeptide repeats
MANQEHLGILKQGVGAWNQWRREKYDIRPNLVKANLRGANLSDANLSDANLSDANLSDANLSDANLHSANLSGADLQRADLNRANLRKATISKAILRRAMLRKAHLPSACLFGAYLSWADLSKSDLSGAKLFGAYLKGANLSRANLSGADLRMANLSWTDIRAIVPDGSEPPEQAVRHGANLSGANLNGANLSGADLSATNLSGATLHGSDLSWANLSKADLSESDLTGCSIYAVSAWDVELEGAIQSNLIIRNPDRLDAPAITVDNLKVAQFIYLLLNNEEIRHIIDTITSKVVLILGRFTPERKVVLDALREELRKHNYSPVLFDFKRPAHRDLTGTISILAHLARFIIVDLTDPSSTPHEVATVIPQTVVPVQPVMLAGEKEYNMFRDLRQRYHWVLPTYRYTDQVHLLATLQEYIIAPAEQKAQELEKR